jgi:hypothetical protein
MSENHEHERNPKQPEEKDKVARGAGSSDGPDGAHRKIAPDRDNETGNSGGSNTPPATDPPLGRGGH